MVGARARVVESLAEDLVILPVEVLALLWYISFACSRGVNANLPLEQYRASLQLAQDLLPRRGHMMQVSSTSAAWEAIVAIWTRVSFHDFERGDWNYLLGCYYQGNKSLLTLRELSRKDAQMRFRGWPTHLCAGSQGSKQIADLTESPGNQSPSQQSLVRSRKTPVETEGHCK